MIIVTGGAGYIGSHVVELLRADRYDVIVVDDLSTGRRDRVPDVPVVDIDLSDAGAAQRLHHLFVEVGATDVLHFAARKSVADSVARPTEYMAVNVGGMTNLLSAMESAGVPRLVFSSSAAVYGEPDERMVTESTPCEPINPYGQTKLIGEWMATNAHHAWGLSVASLRYFNVAGTGLPRLADVGGVNLIPRVISAMRRGEAPTVFGDRHPTLDGSCIRDYIHVLDLAEAHRSALEFLGANTAGAHVFNIGTGRGASVFEVIAQAERLAGRPAGAVVASARVGDPAELVADPSRAASELGWRSSRALEDIMSSAWGQ